MVKYAVGEYVYDDGNELGEGVFGKVFRGHHKQNENDMVAIKMINLRNSFVKRAGNTITEREIEISEILKSTRHPNLIVFHCHEKIPFVIYLVMEFCNGGNFSEYLQAQEPKTLTESTIRYFFQQIGAGVKFLHENDIVHRDLKPENVLLNFDGQKYPTPENIRLKIGDFGLGRFLTLDEKATTNCGTPRYMAPEVASEDYDKKVDLWSIGIMIYECVVGTKKALKSNAVTLLEDATQDLKELLIGLLKEDPHERFDCRQFMEHNFMLEILKVSIHANGKTRGIQISKKSSVNDLHETALQVFNVNGQADAIFLNIEGRLLDGERNSSVEDAGIRNGSTIVLGYRQPGGIYKRFQTRTSDVFCTSPLTLSLA